MRSQKPKSEVVELQPLEPAVREVATIIRRYRLSYEQLSYVTKMARRRTDLRNPRPTKKLPRNLTDQQLASFFQAIERGGNAEHALLFRLAYFTGLRVAELCGLLRDDVDVHGLTIRVNQGKGSKDRTVLFPEQLRLAMRLHLDSTRDRRFVFESRRNSKLSPRWVQTLASTYGRQAGIEGMTPHRLRHTLLTDLARAGLSDAAVQQISGHADRRVLSMYQHLALSDVRDDYQEAMRQK